jgi:hypothetical protein
MIKKIKFKVSDKLVKQRDGANYSLSNYTEGVDYVMRGCFKGQKAVFREDILSNAADIAEPKSTREVLEEAEHTVVKSPLKWSDELNSWVNSQPESTEPSTGESLVSGITGDASNFDGLMPSYCPVQECKIKKIYNNFKWVETDKGRVWVGLKGSTMRVGQVIRVKNGELFLGKTAPSSSLTKVN